MNQRARPVKYQSQRDYVAANFASRTMRWTGVIVALFVVFHLLDLTWGTANPDFVRGDAYDNLFDSFERVPVAIVYIVAMLALGIHIFHGAWAMFHSLGLNNPRYNVWRRYFAAASPRVITRRQRRACRCSSSPGAVIADESGRIARRQDPRGSHRGEVGPAQVRREAGEPREQASLRDHRRRQRARRRRRRRRTLGELGYHVTLFTFHDSPRRAHSIAAQGGINAAKNYTNDGDSVYRLFYDTVKGGDYRAREAQRVPARRS